ncbi:hypothetical protein ACI78T_18555 [Blastococcus sp. SYSU D00922]
MTDGTVLARPTTGAIPAPRTPGTVRPLPWLEPGQYARGSRPRSQYWDVETARWVTRAAVPGPRRGD